MHPKSLFVTIFGMIAGIFSISGTLENVDAQAVHVNAVYSVPSFTTARLVNEPSVVKKVVEGKPLRIPVYKPPKGIGAPGGRVGGGTRGGHDPQLMLFALVPDHLGLTIQEQPTLYWYVSKEAPYRLVLTFNQEKRVEPVLELTLAHSAKPGIHSVNLMDHHVKLELDTEYNWFVELVVDDDSPAKNIVAGGRIKRVVPPQPLLTKLRTAEPHEVTAIYSEAGLWYDAFASISDLIKTSTQSTQYVKGRVVLLEQVDLMEVSRAEEEVKFTDDLSGLYDGPVTIPVNGTMPIALSDYNE